MSVTSSTWKYSMGTWWPAHVLIHACKKDAWCNGGEFSRLQSTEYYIIGTIFLVFKVARFFFQIGVTIYVISKTKRKLYKIIYDIIKRLRFTKHHKSLVGRQCIPAQIKLNKALIIILINGILIKLNCVHWAALKITHDPVLA